MGLNVAIIGSGWLGCHTALKLKDNHNVSLYDSHGIFTKSSLYNQNRLHKGFHYSRNYLTRTLCQSTFENFIQDYDHLVDIVENNYYIVPQNKSIIDYQTFKNIFAYDGIDFADANVPFLSNIEGGLIVDERYINPLKAKSYFNQQLQPLLVNKEIGYDDLTKLSNENDIVINVTNNTLQPSSEYIYELCLTLVYTRNIQTEFNALTMVDGPFFSIYPYINNTYTLTDVQHTPIYISKDLQEINEYIKLINNNSIKNVKTKMEEKVSYYYNDFRKHFNYVNFFTSIKAKKESESADRSPTIKMDGNILSCVTGKIQGIYTLENYITNEIINR